MNVWKHSSRTPQNHAGPPPRRPSKGEVEETESPRGEGGGPSGTLRCNTCHRVIEEYEPRCGGTACLQCTEAAKGVPGYANEMMRKALAGEPSQQGEDVAVASIRRALGVTSSRGRPRTLSAKMKAKSARRPYPTTADGSAAPGGAGGDGADNPNTTTTTLTTNDNTNNDTKHAGKKRHERPELPPEDEQPRRRRTDRKGVG